MPNSYFIYNGNDCQIWHCYKQQPINFPSPMRDIEPKPVPGRNGELIIDNGRYSNVEVVIECLIESDNFIADFDEMRAALLKDSDYHVLIDSLYPQEYRLASVRTVEAKTKTPTKGTVEIALSCKPQRFIDANNAAVSYAGTTSPPTLYSYSDFSGTPKNAIKAAAAEAGLLESDLSGIKFVVWNVTLAANDFYEFAGAGRVPFFRVYTTATPFNAYTPATYSTSRTGKASAAVTCYFVLPYDFNMKFIVNGVTDSTLDAFDHDDLYNFTMFDAKPTIKVDIGGQSVNGYIGGINDCGIYVNLAASNNVDVMTIDAETMNAYCLPEESLNGEFINCNANVYYTAVDLVIKPGHNDVLINDLTNGMTITPNWWTL